MLLQTLRRLSLAWPAFLLLSVLVGCGSRGPTLVRVRGTVTLDGKPVEGAAVMFMPKFEGRPATGTTAADGSFTLSTPPTGAGALVGQHAVTVTLCKVTGLLTDKDGNSAGIAPEGMRTEWVVPQRYSTPDKSGLLVEVKAGMEPVKLDLRSS